jgi:ABC-type uncharacterized transport system ATPase subunit
MKRKYNESIEEMKLKKEREEEKMTKWRNAKKICSMKLAIINSISKRKACKYQLMAAIWRNHQQY